MTTPEKQLTHLNENTTHDLPNAAGEPAFAAVKYGPLIEFHLKRCGIDKDGNKRPQKSLDNERGIANSWLKHHGLSESDLVGEELGIGFDKSLSTYETALIADGLSKQTVSDRRCIVKKLRESFLALERTSGLPEHFWEALKYLMSRAGIAVEELARRASVPRATISNWIKRTRAPQRSSLKTIRRLEQFFEVPQGTLSSKLPDAVWIKGPRRRGTTRWRRHQSELVRLKYRLLEFPPRLQEEWEQLERAHTDSQWARDHGLKINSEWRIRKNNGCCATADIKYRSLQGFFGFLCLPTDAADPRVRGLGFSPQDLSLALLTDADLVSKFLYFMKGRSVTESFNTATLTFTHLCTMVTRKKTGYLWQIPEFGAKLPQPVAESDWRAWCKKNHKALRKFRKRISKKKKNGKKGRDCVRRTRDPFEPVRDIISERQHPITVLFDLSKRLESLVPQMENGSKRLLAVQWRSIFHVRLAGSNPLRIENFSMMTFIPRDFDSFDRVCELYHQMKGRKEPLDPIRLRVETTDESNLYQRRDGTWWLRFNECDFKNEKGEDIEVGTQDASYDVQVLPSVWPSLMEYLFRQRAFLSGSLGDALQRRLAERGLPLLTHEEEMAITRCPYVFRPCYTGAFSKKKEGGFNLEYCTSQFTPSTMSAQILSLTSKYLPETKGFSAHAFRHLVASDYIKNHPNRYEEAAVVLHNTAKIVREHYAWVKVGDLLKPWNNYHEELRTLYDRGEI